jgi:indole-3-glycerol phosphate synthase
MDILDKIVERKREEITAAQNDIPEDRLREQAEQRRNRRSLYQALKNPGPFGVNIISEIKRASPSKGLIRKDLDPVTYARAYEKGGAAALSVLTDQSFFKGSPEDLKTAKGAVLLPVLRKDFTISTYQIYEAAVMGADAVLLITRILSEQQLSDFLALSTDLQLDALVEVHDEEDLEKAKNSGATLVGINNRNLRTFKTDIETAIELVKRFEPHQVAVAESGIHTRDDIERLIDAGIWNFLIGESLVRAENPIAHLEYLMGKKEK